MLVSGNWIADTSGPGIAHRFLIESSFRQLARDLALVSWEILLCANRNVEHELKHARRDGRCRRASPPLRSRAMTSCAARAADEPSVVRMLLPFVDPLAFCIFQQASGPRPLWLHVPESATMSDSQFVANAHFKAKTMHGSKQEAKKARCSTRRFQTPWWDVSAPLNEPNFAPMFLPLRRSTCGRSSNFDETVPIKAGHVPKPPQLLASAGPAFVGKVLSCVALSCLQVFRPLCKPSDARARTRRHEG